MVNRGNTQSLMCNVQSQEVHTVNFKLKTEVMNICTSKRALRISYRETTEKGYDNF